MNEKNSYNHASSLEPVYTIFDNIYDLIRKQGKVRIDKIAKGFNISKERVEFFAGILKDKGLADITYPAIGEPVLVFRKRKTEIPAETPGEIIESYEIMADGVPVVVNIKKVEGEVVFVYETRRPDIGLGTHAFIDFLIDKLAKDVQVGVEEIIDPKKLLYLKQKVYTKANELVTSILGDYKEKNQLAGIIVHRMHGLGETEELLADNLLEEIVVNSSNTPMVVYHKKYGWIKTNRWVKTEEDVYNLASEIGRKVQRDITNLNPIMDAHLLSGDRVAATLFPISTLGNTVTIRRFARTPWTISQLTSPEYKTLSSEIAAFLWQALQYELNIMVAGGTASGKTSTLNSVCAMIPPTQRIISIEDTRELFLPSYLHWNWVPLTTRNPNPEGQGEVSMLDLMVASLRMRPDRIIVGEIRTKKQAETMFEAMHTGHSVYTTMHADTAEQVKRRLLEPPLEIPKNEIEALQLLLIQYRDRRKNLRRVLELVEILSSEASELELNYIYRWIPRKDSFEKINESVRVVEDLNLHTGMTEREIQEDLQQKKKILEWMSRKNIYDIENVGMVMKKYYESPDWVSGLANKNADVKEILKK